MGTEIIASILAITYGLVEAIKYMLKKTYAKNNNEEYREQLGIILERLKEVRKNQEVKEQQLAEIIRLLDRVTLTQQILAEVTKDNNKMLNYVLKNQKR